MEVSAASAVRIFLTFVVHNEGGGKKRSHNYIVFVHNGNVNTATVGVVVDGTDEERPAVQKTIPSTTPRRTPRQDTVLSSSHTNEFC